MNFNAIEKLVLSQLQDYLNLDGSEIKKLSSRVLTFSTKLRQPRKDDGSCNKTPFFDRWDTNITTSHLTVNDPRYASKEECNNMYIHLLLKLFSAESPNKVSNDIINLYEQFIGEDISNVSLRCLNTDQLITQNDIKKMISHNTQRLGTYDIPIGYITELDKGGKHLINNVAWLKPIHIIYELRDELKRLMIGSGVSAKATKNALDKIQVKSYCTDKVTMPPFYSNRDVRWATWTNSIQYASLFDCVMVELELMSELFEFINGPILSEDLKNEVVLLRGRPITENSSRCFVTGKYMNFNEYIFGATNTNGGRSHYHVGHINPLTRGGKHECTNIAWTSDDGNRIQGNDTLIEIEEKLITAVIFHLERDSINRSNKFDERLNRLSEEIKKYL